MTTKTKKEVETSQEDINRMSELSDEKNTKAAPKFPLASLKVNGKEGGYYKTVLNEDGTLATGEDGKAKLERVENPSGIILRPRKSYAFESPEYQLFTNEGGNTPKSVFSVFEKRETKKGFSIQMIFQGIPAQIKEKYPELKMTQLIYFLLDRPHELVRLKVKGMSLGKIFDYWKEFKKGEHLFQFKTILGEEKDKNQFGKFIKSTFKKGDKVTDFTEVRKSMELISEKITEIEEYYIERDAEAEEFAGGTANFDDDEEPSLDKVNKGDEADFNKDMNKRKKTIADAVKANRERKEEEEAEDEIDAKKLFDD